MGAYDSRSVANRFVEQRWESDKSPLSIMQLVKLVYLAHGWHLGHIGKPLITHKVQAWKYGPVIPEVYQAFRHQGIFINNLATIGGTPFTANFSKEATSIMDAVFEGYSNISPFVLSELTHGDNTPWAQTIKKNNLYAQINNNIIEQHYKSLVKDRND